MSQILFLTPRLPWPLFDGGRIRIFETLKHLAGSHEVTLAVPLRPDEAAVDTAPISRFCPRVLATVRSERPGAVARRLLGGILRRDALAQSYFFDHSLAGQLSDLTSREEFDIIHVEFPLMAPYLRAVRSGRAVRVLSTHNIESIRFERELRQGGWGRRRVLLLADQWLAGQWEVKAIRAFDGVTTVSEIEQSWVRERAPRTSVELVPNGVDTRYFAFSPPCPSSVITFVGSMDYPPNIDAVLWLAESVLPEVRRRLPNFTFRVVGSRADPRVLALADRPGVEVLGQVEDIRPHLAQSLALVVPLRSGGGTRLKILQAMAMGRPVISTAVGAEGIELDSERHCLLAETPEEWVNQVLRVQGDYQLATRLALAGRELVEKKYDWSICLSPLDRLYEQLLSARS